MNFKPCRQAGFTLTEALIATAISASIFAVMTTVLQNTARAVGRIGAATEFSENTTRTANTLRHLFTTMYPPLYYDEDRRFKGDARSLFFVGEPSPAFGPAEIQLNIITDNGAQTLMIDAVAQIPQLGGSPVSAALFAGASSITFSYYGHEDKAAPPVWRSDWSYEYPPLLVAIDAVFLNNAHKPAHFEFFLPARLPAVCPIEDPTCSRFIH